MMQLPCRWLEKFPPFLSRSARPLPVPKSVKTDGCKGKGSANPSRCFRHGRDFPKAVVQVEFNHTGSEAGKDKAA